jgi:hypothetical protein
MSGSEQGNLAAIQRGSHAELLHQDPGSEVAAMQQFERFLEYAPNMHLSGVQRLRWM